MEAERLARLARRRGVVVDAGPDVVVNGARFATFHVRVKDNRALVALLNDCAADDALHAPETRDFAARVAAYALRIGPSAPARELAIARSIHTTVRDRIGYVKDPVQALRSSDVTLRAGVGNCVNTARLLVALAKAAGLEARAVPVANAAGEVRHTCGQIRVGGAWRWAEATILAHFDEEPFAALHRLQLHPSELEALPVPDDDG